jgi:hypothetical protein
MFCAVPGALAVCSQACRDVAEQIAHEHGRVEIREIGQ